MPKHKRPEKDEECEQRIHEEIVVDAYDEEEQAMGWYYSLEDTLTFPFNAKCILKRATSPLKVGENVEVIGMPSLDECGTEMFVTIRWRKEELAVPLSQLEVLDTDDDTHQIVGDWHYWVQCGYQF